MRLGSTLSDAVVAWEGYQRPVAVVKRILERPYRSQQFPSKLFKIIEQALTSASVLGKREHGFQQGPLVSQCFPQPQAASKKRCSFRRFAAPISGTLAAGPDKLRLV